MSAKPEDPTVDVADVDVVTVLHALADPVRLDIVRQLASCGPSSLKCGELVINVTKSTTSHHIKILTQAGIISEKPEGTAKRLYLRRCDLDAQFPGLLDSVLAAK
jgi:DNA-binding transcriptional ArsR family regulator